MLYDVQNGKLDSTVVHTNEQYTGIGNVNK